MSLYGKDSCGFSYDLSGVSRKKPVRRVLTFKEVSVTESTSSERYFLQKICRLEIKSPESQSKIVRETDDRDSSTYDVAEKKTSTKTWDEEVPSSK